MILSDIVTLPVWTGDWGNITVCYITNLCVDILCVYMHVCVYLYTWMFLSLPTISVFFFSSSSDITNELGEVVKYLLCALYGVLYKVIFISLRLFLMLSLHLLWSLSLALCSLYFSNISLFGSCHHDILVTWPNHFIHGSLVNDWFLILRFLILSLLVVYLCWLCAYSSMHLHLFIKQTLWILNFKISTNIKILINIK